MSQWPFGNTGIKFHKSAASEICALNHPLGACWYSITNAFQIPYNDTFDKTKYQNDIDLCVIGMFSFS